MDQTWTNYTNVHVDNRYQAQILCEKLSGSYHTGLVVHIPKCHDIYAINAAYAKACNNDR